MKTKDITNLNYFISQSEIIDCNKIIEDINQKKIDAETDDSIQITTYDRDALDMAITKLQEVKNRIKLCKTQNKHYWIKNNIQSYSCHWCDILLSEYSRRERERNNK